MFDLVKNFRAFRSIYFAMLSANIAYVLVIVMFDMEKSLEMAKMSDENLTLFRYVAFAYGGLMLVVSPIIKKAMLSSKSIYSSLKNSEYNKAPVYFSRYQTRSFILYAIIEIGSLLGFVYYLFSFDLTLSCAIIAIALVNFIIISPKLSELQTLEENAPL